MLGYRRYLQALRSVNRIPSCCETPAVLEPAGAQLIVELWCGNVMNEAAEILMTELRIVASEEDELVPSQINSLTGGPVA